MTTSQLQNVRPGDMLWHPKHPNDRMEVTEVTEDGGFVCASSRWNQIAAPTEEFSTWGTPGHPPRTFKDGIAVDDQVAAPSEHPVSAFRERAERHGDPFLRELVADIEDLVKREVAFGLNRPDPMERQIDLERRMKKWTAAAVQLGERRTRRQRRARIGMLAVGVAVGAALGWKASRR